MLRNIILGNEFIRCWRKIEGLEKHVCVTREMTTVFHDAYVLHQAKMSYKKE